MTIFAQLKTDLKKAQEVYKTGSSEIFKSYEESTIKDKGRFSFNDNLFEKQAPDFGLSYCLNEAMEQLERCIKEKPSRELSLVKTKLQEAYFWSSQV